MRSVHYFPRYSQRENVVTNNTLLLFARLMETSRSRFEEFLGKLAGDSDLHFSPQWLRIGQQKKSATSVVDGFIAQDSVKIAVETKLGEAFDSDQLMRHLATFERENHKLLILLCPIVRSQPGAAFDKFIDAAREQGVGFLHTSFEKVIAAFRAVLGKYDNEMEELIADFEEYCSAENLLPTDSHTVFVPPCGPSHADNEQWHLYYCPSNLTRRGAAYLGIYADKTVRAIGRISKVVACQIDAKAGTVVVSEGPPITNAEQERILAATRNAPTLGWDITTGHKFYLCDEWATTDFRKVTPNGIWGHRYFDLRKEFPAGIPVNLEDIANQLAARTWE